MLGGYEFHWLVTSPAYRFRSSSYLRTQNHLARTARLNLLAFRPQLPMCKSGEPFEKLVAKIQARIDPSSTVSHSEFIVDRLGQRRQFDVVIRGTFAGQSILGVIECKDLGRKVGTPEVDAFHTKAQDANANFTVIASKSGFTRPAVDKARHYGIRLVSLLDPDVLRHEFPIGDWWTARVFRWSRLAIQAYPVEPVDVPIDVAPERLLIGGNRVLDWFQNHLLKVGHDDRTVGWVVGFRIEFDRPVEVNIRDGLPVQCMAIDFHAERECREYERFVPVSAEAFVDWHRQTVTIPEGTTISTAAVPADVHSWPAKDPKRQRISSLFPVTIEAHDKQFEHAIAVPNLEAL